MLRLGLVVLWGFWRAKVDSESGHHLGLKIECGRGLDGCMLAPSWLKDECDGVAKELAE